MLFRSIRVGHDLGDVVGAKVVADTDELMLISHEGMMVRSPVKDVRSTGRATQGVRLISMKGKDRVASVARVAPKEEESEEGKPAAAVVEAPPTSPASQIKDVPPATPKKAKTRSQPSPAKAKRKK